MCVGVLPSEKREDSIDGRKKLRRFRCVCARAYVCVGVLPSEKRENSRDRRKKLYRFSRVCVCVCVCVCVLDAGKLSTVTFLQLLKL